MDLRNHRPASDVRGKGEDEALAGWPRSRLRRGRLVPILILALAAPLAAGAQVRVPADSTPQMVFAGGGRSIIVLFQNVTDQPMEMRIRIRLLQASSSTAMSVSERGWKVLTVLPRQTVLETTRIEFPTVNAPTRFLVQWIEEPDRVLGRSEVIAYPADLLREVKTLAGGRAIGLFDPLNQLKPLLGGLAIGFEDLERVDWKALAGGLAILGPFAAPSQWPEGFARRVRALAKTGAAVIWWQPAAPDTPPRLGPAAYAFNLGDGVLVLARDGAMADLAGNPLAQLNLIQMVRLALRPEPFQHLWLTN